MSLSIPSNLIAPRLSVFFALVFLQLFYPWAGFWEVEEARLTQQVNTKRLGRIRSNHTKLEPARAPPIIVHRNDNWPRNDTDIFLPDETVNRSELYSDYNIVVYAVCCPGSTLTTQAFNEEYFGGKGIAYVRFNQCDGGGDWDRIKKGKEIISHFSHADFLVWMDCDAGVVAGPQENIDPYDRFLSPFDLHANTTNEEAQVGMVVSRHSDFEGGPACKSKYWLKGAPRRHNDCLVNSGVFVLRNNPLGRSIVDRLEQIMTLDNVTSRVPGMSLPDSSQMAFNDMMAEQIYLTGKANHPIRPVYSAQFNRKFPPNIPQSYDAVRLYLIHLNNRLHLFDDYHLKHYWASFFQGEFFLGTKLLARLVGWGGPLWDKEVPTFIIHPWGQSLPYRASFWDCAYTVQPRLADRIVDECG